MPSSRFIHAGAVYARMDRQEAVPVPESHREVVYYHGTPSTDDGESILQDGELRPGVSDFSEPGFSMSPIAGHVYLTPELEYALGYAKGPVAKSVRKEEPTNNPYGYLFVVQGKDLVDMVPDEDVLGTLLCSDEPSWLRDEFERLLDKHPRAYEEMWEMSLSDAIEGYENDPELDPDFDPQDYAQDYHFLQDLYGCAFPEVALAGKFLIDYLEEEDLVELTNYVLLRMGERTHQKSFSHKGPVKFSEAWRFPKNSDQSINKDNFFELAERVK